jgi:hypothetical protein
MNEYWQRGYVNVQTCKAAELMESGKNVNL